MGIILLLFFKPVSAIRVTEILKVFIGFTPALQSERGRDRGGGTRSQNPPVHKLSTFLCAAAHPHTMKGNTQSFD